MTEMLATADRQLFLPQADIVRDGDNPRAIMIWQCPEARSTRRAVLALAMMSGPEAAGRIGIDEVQPSWCIRRQCDLTDNRPHVDV